MSYDDAGNQPGNEQNKHDELDPDGRFTALTGSLGSTFQSQADRFEPSNDAYAKLAQAVAQDQDRRQRRVRSYGWARPLAAAAVVVATVGIGGLMVTDRGSQSLSSEPGEEAAETVEGNAEESEESDLSIAPVEEPVVPTTIAERPDTTQSSLAEPDDASVTAQPGYGPIRATELEAAQAFMDLLRLDNGTPEMDADGRVFVRSFQEGGVGEGTVVAELAMANLASGFAVREAYSESVIIDAVVGGDKDDATMRIEGSGTGFESVLDVKVVAAFDNRVIGSGFVQAGNFGRLEPFAAEVEVSGDEHGWVVVSSSGGASGVIDPFAAKAVSFMSVPDANEYAVIGVAADDPDGGLVIRSGPGAGNELVGILPGGTTGLTRNEEYPVLVDTGTWWSISTAEGLSGWVNSRYIASNEPISDEDLVSLGAKVQFLVTEPAELPLTRRAPVAIGAIGYPFGESADQLRTESGWTDQRAFPMPEAVGSPAQTSLIQLTMAEGWVDVDPEIEATYTYESVREAASVNFAGLSAIVFAPENTTGAWSRTFLFAENTPAGPEIVGIVVEVQEP